MMKCFSCIFLLASLDYLEHVVGKCRTDSCKRKEYIAIKGSYHGGKELAVFNGVPLKLCIVRCRTYLECRSFHMQWNNPSRTFGICTLLEEVSLMNLETDAVPNENFTHYCKLFSNILVQNYSAYSE